MTEVGKSGTDKPGSRKRKAWRMPSGDMSFEKKQELAVEQMQ